MKTCLRAHAFYGMFRIGAQTLCEKFLAKDDPITTDFCNQGGITGAPTAIAAIERHDH